MKRFFQHPIMLFFILALGVAGAFFIVKGKPPVEHAENEMPAKPVYIINVKKRPFAAHVTAYGNVEPAVLLESKAEVSGKISYIHPRLKQGGSITAGTVVIKIDPEDYKVSLKQTEEDLAVSRSALAQLEEEERSTKRSLRLSKKNLEVGEAEYRRVKELWDKRLISRSTLDVEEQKVIQLRQQVEELKGQLNSFDSRRTSTKAQIARAKQQVKGQKTTLGRTEVKVPFDARIGNVAVDKGEFVSVGGLLFEALGIDSVEIEAQLPIQHMRGLVSALGQSEIDISAQNAHNILKAMNLTAKVQLVGESQAQWDAQVLRMSEAIDPIRRTIGLVVAIDKPYAKVIPGKRPPLLKGMYVAVNFYAPTKKALVIPRKAIHQGRVYLANDDDRLEIREIEVQVEEGNLAVIQSGLDGGERLIVNDLIPVIENMPLAPKIAEEVEKTLEQHAIGVDKDIAQGTSRS